MFSCVVDFIFGIGNLIFQAWRVYFKDPNIYYTHFVAGRDDTEV